MSTRTLPVSLDTISLVRYPMADPILTRRERACRMPFCRRRSHLRVVRRGGQSDLHRSDRVPSRCSSVSRELSCIVFRQNHPPINVGSVIASVLQSRRSESVRVRFRSLPPLVDIARLEWHGDDAPELRDVARKRGVQRLKGEEEGKAPMRRLGCARRDPLLIWRFGVSYLSDAVSGAFVSARASGRRSTPVRSATATTLLSWCKYW